MAIDSLTGSPKAVNPTNGPPIVKKKKEIDPEVKKIDILLKLGVGMILISGIIFLYIAIDDKDILCWCLFRIINIY